jgi:predicted dehydrogenase
MTKDLIRIAIIGAGGMAREHIKAFQGLSGIEVSGIYSRTLKDAQNLATEFNIPKYSDSILELLNAGKINLLVVAVAVTASHDVLFEVLEYGIPILTEKPVGLDLAECENIVLHAKTKKTQLWVGLNRRCYGATLSALSGLKDDPNPRYIEIHDQQDKQDAIDLNIEKRVIENWMYANSIHLVDYARIFARGDISNVEVLDPWRPDEKSCMVSARISFSKGDIVYYKAFWGMPGPWACVITTAKNRWELRPLETAKQQKYGTRTLVDLPTNAIDQTYKAGLHLQASDVVEAIRNGRDPVNVPDGEEALVVTRLVSQVYSTVQ